MHISNLAARGNSANTYNGRQMMSYFHEEKDLKRHENVKLEQNY